MNFSDFIRILFNNIILVIGIPIIMMILVFFGTINNPKEYTSRTTIYTGIVSGNNMDNSVGMGGRYVVPSIFDNLKTLKESGKVLQNVSLKLLTQHLLADSANKDIISKESIAHLHELLPQNLIDSLTVKGDFDATFKRLLVMANSNRENLIYRLLSSKEHHYSINALSKIEFYRLKESDIIAFEYKSDDPAICVNTLNFFLDEFIDGYKNIKLSETGNIIEYFIEQVEIAQQNLRAKESNLQTFRENNNILDYIEQVRAIAIKKEDMEGEYYEEKMQYASAKTSVKFIEDELNIYENLMAQNENLLEKKEQLEKFSQNLAAAELMGGVEENQIAALRNKTNSLRKEVEQIIGEIAQTEYTKTGKNTKALLLKWLENVVLEAQTKARLDVFEERKAAYRKTYSELSPLGSEITRLEREVGVAEQEYLRMVESLNLANLKKQNADLTTNLTVMDAPYYPLYPNPSKRIMLILIAAILGFVFTTLILILLEFTDTTLKSIEIFQEKTKLVFAGAFPRVGNNKKVDYDLLKEKCSSLIYNNIESEIEEGGCIAITSTQAQDGKSYIAENFAKQLEVSGYQTKTITKGENEELFKALYQKKGIKSSEELREIVGLTKSETILIVELDELMEKAIPLNSLKSFSLILNVTRANRNWKKGESIFLENLKKEIPNIYGIVNGLKLQYLETFIGDIPRERSKMRQIFKRLISFEFKGASHL